MKICITPVFSRHKVLFEWVDELSGLGGAKGLETKDSKGKRYVYEWINQIPLNGSESADDVDFFQFKIINKAGKVTYKNSWVTDIPNH